MSVRRAWLDECFGETRGVVTLDGRPERLLIERPDDPACQRLGARLVARVRRVQRAQGLAFLETPAGPDAVLNLAALTDRLVEGQAVEIEIRAEGRKGKGPLAQWVGLAEGPPRLLAEGPSLASRLRAYTSSDEVISGHAARTVAEDAQLDALETRFAVPAGGSVAIEPTRALTAVDVDLGAGVGVETKRAARSANFAAIALAARVLRLKGLGGLIVFDLVGRGHDAPALISAARAAFAPDNPGVAFGPISRFGTLELTIPRRTRGALDVLLDADGSASATTRAHAMARALEREALADSGGRFEARAAPEVAMAATAAMNALAQRFGARFVLRPIAGAARGGFEVARL